MTEPTKQHIADLRFDPRNARKHTPRNVGMIGTSLQETGAGRSIVLDKNGVILAGNATIEAAAAAGFEDVLVVETDGRTIVAVKRTDLEHDSEMATKLALYDNRTAEFAYWDRDVIQELIDEGVDVSTMWYDDELDKLLKADDIDTAFAPDESANKGFKNYTFSLTPDQYADIDRTINNLVMRGLGDSPDNPHKPGNALHYLIAMLQQSADIEDIDVPA